VDLTFSNEIVKSFEPDKKPEVIIKKEENLRIQQIKKKERFAFKDGQKISDNKVYSIRDGLFEPILDKFYEDPTFIAFAEEIREWDGSHGVTRGLTSALPFHRLFNTPIAETAILSGALGYAMSGGRAIVEIMYGDFIGCIGDEIFMREHDAFFYTRASRCEDDHRQIVILHAGRVMEKRIGIARLRQNCLIHRLKRCAFERVAIFVLDKCAGERTRGIDLGDTGLVESRFNGYRDIAAVYDREVTENKERRVIRHQKNFISTSVSIKQYRSQTLHFFDQLCIGKRAMVA
jgi:hypothetical protein